LSGASDAEKENLNKPDEKLNSCASELDAFQEYLGNSFLLSGECTKTLSSANFFLKNLIKLSKQLSGTSCAAYTV